MLVSRFVGRCGYGRESVYFQVLSVCLQMPARDHQYSGGDLVPEPGIGAGAPDACLPIAFCIYQISTEKYADCTDWRIGRLWEEHPVMCRRHFTISARSIVLQKKGTWKNGTISILGESYRAMERTNFYDAGLFSGHSDPECQ